MATRNVVLTDAQFELANRLASSGGYQNPADALLAGLRLLEREEAELRARLAGGGVEQAGAKDVAAGDGEHAIRRARADSLDPMQAARGSAVVVQPEQGRSWWQPMPANGHADPKLVPSGTGFDVLSMGYQTIAPGGRVRPHSHGAQVELQICFRGRASVVVDGTTHPLVPGTACFLGPDVKHEIVNGSDDDLVMLWVISPAGLEDFFASVGRERIRDEPPPSPFARPCDVIAIERELGMEDTTADG